MTKNEKGFTVIELLVVLAFLAQIALMVGIGYIVVHFIQKFW